VQGERSLSDIVKTLKETKSLEERRRILFILTKEEKQALYSELYFEEGRKVGISLYNGFIRKGIEYARWLSPEYTLAYLYIKKLKCKRVLELGCATGGFVKVLRRLGIEAYGIDISSYTVSKADVDVRSFLYNIDVETEDIPFPEEYFDMIIAIETLEHLANITFALNNLKRVLKVGGFLFITVPKPQGVLDNITHVNL